MQLAIKEISSESNIWINAPPSNGSFFVYIDWVAVASETDISNTKCTHENIELHFQKDWNGDGNGTKTKMRMKWQKDGSYARETDIHYFCMET